MAGLEFDKFFKRYVWDDDRTPYLISVSRLNRRQADYEVLTYTLFIGILFGIVTLASLSAGGPLGRSTGTALYGFTVVCAAVVFYLTRNVIAAWYLGGTPIVGLAFILTGGFGGERERIDTIIVIAVLVLLALYSRRIIALARAWPGLPDPPADNAGPHRRRFRG